METQKVQYWDVYVDGASFPAKKKAAIGVVLHRPNLQVAAEQGVVLPSFLNSHEAEFHAVVAGLTLANQHGVKHLRLHCDNSSLVGQLRGTFKVNAAGLKLLHSSVLERAKHFSHVEYVPINREQNKIAHELANKALSATRAPMDEIPKPRVTPTKVVKVAIAVPTIKSMTTADRNASISCIPLPSEAPRQFWKPVGDELWVWNLPRLWNVVNTAPVEVVDLDELNTIIEATGWFGNEPLTLNRVADLARHVNGADKDIPLLLDSEGDLLDGRFRLAKALCEGRKQIPVKRLKKLPAPDGRFPLHYCP